MPVGAAASSPAPAAARKRGALFWVVTSLAVVFFFSTLVLLVLCAVLFAAISAREGRGRFIKQTVCGEGPDEVLLLPVEGVITTMGSSDLFGSYPGTVEWVQEQLRQAREDENISALILAVDSPGGEISACDAIYQEILKYRQETDQKVVTLMRDTAASGGYYIACASDRIVAHPTTITGSIGVILPWIGFHGLMDKIGVEMRPIASGPHKELGAGYRPMREEERQLLQGIVNELHAQFVSVVEQGFARRGAALAPERIRTLADGMVYTGRRAKELGLVDEVGYLDDAVREACRLAGVTEAKVVRYRPRPGLLSLLFGGGMEARRAALDYSAGYAARADTPRFMYLWTAGQGIILSSARMAVP